MISKAYKDTKEDLNDVSTLVNFYDQFFTERVFMESQPDRICPSLAQVGLIEFVAQPSYDCIPELVIRDPARLFKMKGRSKVAIRLDLEGKTSIEKKEKGLLDTVGSKVIFLLGVRNIRWICTIFKVKISENGQT